MIHSDFRHGMTIFPVPSARVGRVVRHCCDDPGPTRDLIREYTKAGLGAPPGSLAGVESHWLQRVGKLVEKAAATTGQLATGLDRYSGEMAAPLAALVDASALSSNSANEPTNSNGLGPVTQLTEFPPNKSTALNS